MRRRLRLFHCATTISKRRLSNLLIPDLVSPEDQHVRLSTLSSTYMRDTATSHWMLKKEFIKPSNSLSIPTFLGIERQFRQTQRAAGLLQELGKGIIWANSVRIGIEQQFAGSHVPQSELFFRRRQHLARFPAERGRAAAPSRSAAILPTPQPAAFIRCDRGRNSSSLIPSFVYPSPQERPWRGCVL